MSQALRDYYAQIQRKLEALSLTAPAGWRLLTRCFRRR